MDIKVVKNVLQANDAIAAEIRELFARKKIFVLNLMSSPGSGKTSVLERTLAAISKEIKCAVIVGDICTSADAYRLGSSRVEVVQINTDAFGGDCHLGAHVIREALTNLELDGVELLVVENVGNLVCPAEFDIGEDQRAVVLSVTEGEDKPLKYPLMFRVCEVALLNKIDLLPHLDFDRDLVLANIHKVKADLPVLELSAKTGEGFEAWLDWLRTRVAKKRDQD